MRNLLRSHGHRLVLGGALAAWVAFGIASIRPSAADAIGWEAPVREVRDRIGLPHPAYAPPASVPSARPHLAGWAVAAGDAAGSPWAAALRPSAAGTPVAAPPPPPPAPRPRLGFTAAPRGPYVVDLAWSLDARLLVERRVEGAKDWVRVPVGSGTRFSDEGVAPGRPHEYRAALPGTDVVESARVVVPGPFATTFQSPGVDSVWVTIEKQDRTHGLVKVSGLQRAGERLGSWPDGAGLPPSTIHWIRMNGKPVQVDFDPGITVLSVSPVSVDAKHRRCRPKVTPVGLLCEEAVDLVRTPATGIRLSAEGRDWTLTHPPVEDKDQRCSRHRGS